MDVSKVESSLHINHNTSMPIPQNLKSSPNQTQLPSKTMSSTFTPVKQQRNTINSPFTFNNNQKVNTPNSTMHKSPKKQHNTSLFQINNNNTSFNSGNKAKIPKASTNTPHTSHKSPLAQFSNRASMKMNPIDIIKRSKQNSNFGALQRPSVMTMKTTAYPNSNTNNNTIKRNDKSSNKIKIA